MSDGYLRRSVRITRAAGVVSLSHAFWTLDLPAAWVGTAPGISALLNRRACVHDLPSADPEVQGVVALLKAQRCLSYPDDHDVYTLAQARELFKEEFYARVSARYGLDGFFRNWESHVQLDLAESHADDFSTVLASGERCTRADLVYSLHNAWLTFQFLLGALDDVVAEDRDDDRLLLRLPIDHAALDPDRTALLAPYRASLEQGAGLVDVLTASECQARLSQLGLAASRPDCSRGLPSSPAADFLRIDLTNSIFRSMAFAHGHDEIVILGHLAQMAMGQVAAMAESPFEHRRQPDSHHAMALANFFRELTSRPIDFAFALRHAVALADGQERENPVSWLPVESAGTALLDTFLAQFVVGKADLDRLVTLAIQLNEFYARWITSAGQAEPIDFFRD